MNARQKAKSYKKQLEAYERLNCPTNTIYVDRTQLTHRKIAFAVYAEDLMHDPGNAMNEVCRKACHELMPIVRNNITELSEPLNNAREYVFDVWTLK